MEFYLIEFTLAWSVQVFNCFCLSEIKLEILTLEAETLRRKSVPAPHSRLSSPVLAVVPVQSSTVSFGTANDAQVNFDVTNYIKLVPPIQQAEVDAYFIAFECTAEKHG